MDCAISSARPSVASENLGVRAGGVRAGSGGGSLVVVVVAKAVASDSRPKGSMFSLGSGSVDVGASMSLNGLVLGSGRGRVGREGGGGGVAGRGAAVTMCKISDG